MGDTERDPELGTERRRLSRRVFLRLAAGTGLGISSASLLAACAPAAAPSPTAAPAKEAAKTAPAAAQKAPAQKQVRELSMLLDVTPYGKHALYYAGQDHGEFGKAGFNVTFNSGQGSGDVARKIGAKAAHVGLADTGAVIIARGEGAKVKQTFMTHYKNLMSIMSLKKHGIQQPKDLEGKTIASVAGDAGLTMLPAFAKINNFDHTKINILITDFPSKPPTVFTEKAHGAYEFYTSWPTYVARAKEQNVEVSSMLYADHGLDIYNNGMIWNEETLQSDPNMVKEFLHALGEAFVWASENPDAANEITLKYNPALKKDIARQELQVHLDHMLVDEVMKNGIGTMSEDKMRKTHQLVTENFQLKNPVGFDEFWTSEFAPKGLIPKTSSY